MDKRTKVAVCVAAAHNLLSMMAVIIASRKRKRNARSAQITYAPLHVSGTGWDEDNFIITLNEEHNNGFIKVRNQLPQVLCCNTQSCRP